MTEYYEYKDEDDHFIVRVEGDGTNITTFSGTVVKVLRGTYYTEGYWSDGWSYDDFTKVNYVENTPEEENLQEEYSYYNYTYKGIKLDPYRILDIYKITCPAQQHAIKKLLRAGNSVKELKQDITEVIDTLKRKLEMLEEDSVNENN